MIGYITLGTNDLPKSGEYFDKLFAPLGVVTIVSATGRCGTCQ